MFLATLETSLFVIVGLVLGNSEKSQSSLLSKSFKIALALAIAVAPLQIYVGHLSAEQVYKYQPENWRQWRHSGTQFHLSTCQLEPCGITEQ